MNKEFKVHYTDEHGNTNEILCDSIESALWKSYYLNANWTFQHITADDVICLESNMLRHINMNSVARVLYG